VVQLEGPLKGVPGASLLEGIPCTGPVEIVTWGLSPGTGHLQSATVWCPLDSSLGRFNLEFPLVLVPWADSPGGGRLKRGC
jgi:hypothetical protein